MSKLVTTYFCLCTCLVFALLVSPSRVEAASLLLQPATGVYQPNNIFSVRVVVNSSGASINAAEGALSFNPAELSVVSVDRTNSIFSLWVSEPTFSNTAGTVNFSGGVPAGYTGQGTVFTVTFRALVAGSPRVTFSAGSVLANDGRGSNVVSGMTGGTYTIQAPSSVPAAEVVQYVASANTPGAPNVTSPSHERDRWSSSTTAVLNWTLPVGVTEVRTLLSDTPNAIPTRVYEDPIRTITIDSLEDGENYFLVQFRNSEGWGRVTQYPLLVDTESPKINSVTLAPEQPSYSVRPTLLIDVADTVSGVTRYQVQLPDGTSVLLQDTDKTGRLVLPELAPGLQTIVIEAYDEAGNRDLFNFTFQIESFAAPTLDPIPAEIADNIIPVFRGETKPNSEVIAYLQLLGSEPVEYRVQADQSGQFQLIPAGALPRGVYELSVEAYAADDARSLRSEPVRFVVQPAGYLRIGLWLIDALSVIVPLVALTVLLVLLMSYVVIYFRRFRQTVYRESAEVVDIVQNEFKSLQQILASGAAELAQSKRNKKLNEVESNLVKRLESALTEAEHRVLKEAIEVEDSVLPGHHTEIKS